MVPSSRKTTGPETSRPYELQASAATLGVPES
jgi:hypothetical protein